MEIFNFSTFQKKKSYKRLSYKNFHKRQKIKRSHRNQKVQFLNSFLIFFCNFPKKAPEYIDPSGNFVFFMKFMQIELFIRKQEVHAILALFSNFFGEPRELHLDDVLEVLLVGGWNLFFTKLIDNYYIQ